MTKDTGALMPFPSSAKQIVTAHTVDRYITPNDSLHILFVKQVDDEENFFKYLRATKDSDAITGSVYLDRAHAARHLMDIAKEEKIYSLMNLRERAMVRHLKVVIRRERRKATQDAADAYSAAE